MTDRELMQMALNALEDDSVLKHKQIAFALRDRLAQPEPEPVAWLFQNEETGLTECVDIQQVEWGFEKNNPRWQKIAPLYTAPPKKEWVGLTHEELAWLNEALNLGGRYAVIEAIEAKIREKNT